MQIVDLNNFDLIAIDGVDAKKFLQGQVTCDIDELTPAHSIEGAICNIKGRVTGDFRLLEFEDKNGDGKWDPAKDLIAGSATLVDGKIEG